MVDGKVCTKCGLWRPWIDYYVDYRRRGGKQSVCRHCMIAAASKTIRAKKQYGRARGRALTRLSKEYPDRFEQLLSAELAKERADG